MDLLIFQNLLEDKGIAAILENDYSKALRYIIEFSEQYGITEYAAREYVVNLLLREDNILSLLLQKNKKIGNDLERAAFTDISAIYSFLFSAPIRYIPSGNDVPFSSEYKSSVRKIAESENEKQLYDSLCEHYKSLGCGELSKYNAFKLDDSLKGVVVDESVTLDSLVGLEYQKNILIENTKAFVCGQKANNVLLFGDRGTGKSSSVKAILNMFKGDGLRMIEVPKNKISEIPKLINSLSGRPNKYILFLDDLTFETHDAEYRALKIAMDGQLEAHPDNVIMYATSNRRHLIKENWSDREDVHKNDNMQENLSLSERFGISLVFSSPNQAEYLTVVKELLARYDIKMNEEIEKKAVVWQMNYGGRNPRLAKQFVDDYVAKNIK